MKPDAKANTPADVQAVFDALDTYAQNGEWTSANATLVYDGSGLTHTIQGTDRAGNLSRCEERIIGVRVAVTPQNAQLEPGWDQQFYAAAYNPDGSQVSGATFTWMLQSPAYGTISPTGDYHAPPQIPAPMFDTVTASLSGGQSWASVTVQLMPPAAGTQGKKQ